MSHAIQILVQRGTLSDMSFLQSMILIALWITAVDMLSCWHAELLIESLPVMLVKYSDTLHHVGLHVFIVLCGMMSLEICGFKFQFVTN